jgi:alkanesulfonate monooxygenase SsuD/methylene tetrahydromethanopterin reductase-like flavin-dependent oxidoreductase (luciferase family)
VSPRSRWGARGPALGASDVRRTRTGSLVPVAQLGERRPVTRLGLLLEGPFYGRDGGLDSRGDGRLFERMASLAESAEEAGFDSLWVNDRMADSQSGSDDGHGLDGTGLEAAGLEAAGLEAYSLLGALAARTDRIRLGALPRGEDPRAPSILAKIVTGIDVISHGRSVATLGSGLEGSGSEGAGSGEPRGEDPHADRLTEGLRVCRAVLDEEGIEFSGTFYDIHGALNRPRPVQVGGIPLALWVDDGCPLGPEVLTAAIGYVDAVMIGGDATAVAGMVEIVRAASLLHDKPADSVPVIWVASSPPSESEAALDTGQLEGVLDAGADGCILSAGTDAHPESIRRAVIQLSAAMRSAWAGESRTGP